tara:strand:- start:813 stop:1172 length:360 start_codon:yes stop_codon:yes gene_type:complete
MIKKIKLKIIKNKKGNLIKFFNFKKIFFKNYGEIYFSEVKRKYFKGWKFHNNRNQLLTVISGTIIFSFKKSLKSKPKEIKLSYPKNLYALFVPKKTYYSFKCTSKKVGIIVNFIDEIVK